MRAASMERLIGAYANMKLSETPMRVYREAERRGDTEGMERAMGYVTEFQEKAQEYADKIPEELAKELREERREQELRQNQGIEQRREETQKYQETLQECSPSGMQRADSVEISQEGQAALKGDIQIKAPTAAVGGIAVKGYTGKGKSVPAGAASVLVDVKIGE